MSALLHVTRLAATLVCVVALAGCDSLGEPDRFYNDAALPPTVVGLDAAGLTAGQHIAGTVSLTIDLDSIATRIDRVVFRVDDEDVTTLRQGPYAFTLATETYPPGEHVITVSVYVRTPQGGLLTLAGAPDVLLGVPVVFDQRPPTPVAVTSATLEGARPRVTWTASQDANFYAYVVYRRPTESESSEAWPGEEIATVFDRSQTTFSDAELPAVYGGGATYRVAVWNRRDRALSQASTPVRYGTSYPELVPSTGLVATSLDGQSLYYVAGPRLVEASLATHRLVRTLSLPGSPEVYRFENDIHVDPANGRVIAAVRGSGVQVVDPAAFASVATYAFPFTAHRFAVAGGRIYTVDWRDSANRLLVLDAQSGAIVSSSAAVDMGTTAVVGVSPDGRSVYVINATGSSQTMLIRYDVSGPSPRAAERRPLGYSVYNWDVTVAPDGRVFAFVGSTVTVLSGSTLQPLSEATPPDGSRLALTVRLRGNRLYVAYNGTTPWIRGGGEVAEYDATSMQLLRTWRFAEAPKGIAFGGPGELLAFSPSATWSVPL